MTIEEQGELLPTVLPSMQALDVPLKDTEALLAVINRAGGKNSQLGRGLKEALFRFGELADPNSEVSGKAGGPVLHKGDSLMKDFENLQAFQQSNPEEFNKVFGPRSAPAIAFVASHPRCSRRRRPSTTRCRSANPSRR
jgi:hypothetical protein